MQKQQDLIVYRDANFYSTFPALARGADETILCGFRRAPMPVEGHLHSRSRAVFVRSRDEGQTWTAAPELICDEDELGQQDPQLSALSDGTLLANFFRWDAHPLREREQLSGDLMHESQGCLWTNRGVATVRSHDHGGHWEDFRRIPREPGWQTAGACRAPVLEMPDGTLRMACYGRRRAAIPLSTAYLLQSADQGRHWEFLASIAEGDASMDEPCLVLTAGGRLLSFIRCTKDGWLRYCYSDDGGRTWSRPQTTGVWGYPASLLRLRDRRLLLACGYRREPMGVRARLLNERGDDFNTAPELVVRDDACTKDAGYPCMTQLRNGNILLAYYIGLADAPAVRFIGASVLAPDA